MLFRSWTDGFEVTDEITHESWHWGANSFVRLSPDQPAHILSLRRYP